MEVVDLQDEHRQLYFCCLDDWSDDIKEGVDRKQAWFEKMRDRGLRVKLAVSFLIAYNGD